jgi:hypothetical protein
LAQKPREGRSIFPSVSVDGGQASNPVPVPSKNKYAHIQSKVKTYWTAKEIEQAGVKKFFDRKGTGSTSVSASNSASSSMASSPNTSYSVPHRIQRRSLQYQLSGQDFTVRLNELRESIKNDNSLTESKNKRELIFEEN